MDLQVIADRLAAYDPGPADGPALEETLAAIALVRAELDGAERRAIERARAGGLTWQRVARALGLGSRQAAEQRWLRLTRSQRGRQEFVDNRVLLELRAAVESLRIQLRHGAAEGPVGLARTSLDLAAQAPPGPLHDLVGAALDDLDGVRLGRRLRYAVHRVRSALQT
ncbi:hypothetical protein [Rhizomonospora bruguierae]|uniref:hypothetical protein n=1 Tax=Rhizomonospora bruguierae TaxID=1581705 RepID=UPI001BCEA402|nr:hypothetical protein [Micromonospora sp. NBRC 107566]